MPGRPCAPALCPHRPRTPALCPHRPRTPALRSSRCKKNYYLDANKTCQSCKVANCEACSSTGTCATCKAGFYVNGEMSAAPQCAMLCRANGILCHAMPRCGVLLCSLWRPAGSTPVPCGC